MPELIEGEESDDDDDDVNNDVDKNKAVPLGRGHRVRKKPTKYVPALHHQPKNMKRV